MRSSGRLALFWSIVAAGVVGGLLLVVAINRRLPEPETTRLERQAVRVTLVLRGRLQRLLEVSVQPPVAGWVEGRVPEIGDRVEEGARILTLRAEPHFVAEVKETLARRQQAGEEIRHLGRLPVRSPAEGTLVRWDVEPGATVEKGQTLASVLRSGGTGASSEVQPVPAPAAGRLLPFLVSPGTAVTPRDDLPLVFVIPDDGPQGAEPPREAADAITRLLRADADLERLSLAASRPYPGEGLPAERAFMVAPLSGVVTWRALSLVPGAPVRTEERVLALASAQRVVLAKVHEVDYPSLQPGQPVSVAFDAFPDLDLEARLLGKNQTPSASVFDQFSEYSAVFSLSSTPSELVDGMSCNLEVTLASRPNAESLPIAAVVRGAGPPSVWVERERGWQPVPVRIGLVGDMRVEILGGLSPSDAVALAPEMLPPASRLTGR